MSDDLMVRLTLVADWLDDGRNPDGRECVLEAVAAIGEMRGLICRALTGLALADHLGDVRNNEGNLYRALDIDINAFARRLREDGEDPAPIELLAAAADEFNLPVPDYVLAADEG